MALLAVAGGNPAFTRAPETSNQKTPSADGKVPREGFDLHHRIYGDKGPLLIVLTGGPGGEPGYMIPVVEALRSGCNPRPSWAGSLGLGGSTRA